MLFHAEEKGKSDEDAETQTSSRTTRARRKPGSGRSACCETCAWRNDAYALLNTV